MLDLKELRNKLGKLIHNMRAILDKAEEEKRDLSNEEDKNYNLFFAEQEKLSASIKREERQVELDREAAELKLRDDKKNEKKTLPSGKESTDDLRMKAFRSWIKTGEISGEGAEEFRALQADIDTTGGYLVVPEQFIRNLIKAVDDVVFIRTLATVIPVTEAASLGVPSLDTDPADADWTSEIGSVTEDTAMALGKRSLTPAPLTKLALISQKLLRVAAISPEQLVLERLAYKFGITQEKGFLTGHGANQPLGLFIASSDGISTGRDVSIGNTTTDIQFDGLIEAKYKLKGQYWARAQWIFHRDAVKNISKLKDGNGQYIWQPSVIVGQPDRILNFPYNMSEYAPNTFESTKYVGILGDYSLYWIADSLMFQVQRLVELYAATSQVGFIGRAEVDGMPVLEEAFVRVQLA